MVGRRRHSTALLSASLLCLLTVLVGCTTEQVQQTSQPSPGTTQAVVPAPSTEPSAAPVLPYDVRPLLTPSRKYFGAAVDGAPTSVGPVEAFTTKVGKQPNMLLYFTAWGDSFNGQGVRNAWAIGALPVMSWEPFEPSLAAIADGASDAYVRQLASDVRALNLPVAISLAHEMNGFWYPWGTRNTSPADFVRAWRRVHGIFLDVGATNVIWVWSPNVVNSLPDVPLEPFYPGDSYVDWIGVAGYYETGGDRTFTTLFGPTRTAVRAFSPKPLLILETGVESGPRKAKDIADLFAGVAASSDVVGLTWFNYVRRADWRVDSDPSALDQFRASAQSDRFGFDVRKP
jgi:hypothetical protein